MDLISNLLDPNKPQCPKVLAGLMSMLGIFIVAVAYHTDASVYALAGIGAAAFGISGWQMNKGNNSTDSQ